jgi:hypothetical protein
LIQSAIENLLAMYIVHDTSMISSTIVTMMNMTVKLGIILPKSTMQKIDQMQRYRGSNSNKNTGHDNNNNYNKAAAATKRRKK